MARTSLRLGVSARSLLSLSACSHSLLFSGPVGCEKRNQQSFQQLWRTALPLKMQGLKHVVSIPHSTFTGLWDGVGALGGNLKASETLSTLMMLRKQRFTQKGTCLFRTLVVSPLRHLLDIEAIRSTRPESWAENPRRARLDLLSFLSAEETDFAGTQLETQRNHNNAKLEPTES